MDNIEHEEQSVKLPKRPHRYFVRWLNTVQNIESDGISSLPDINVQPPGFHKRSLSSSTNSTATLPDDSLIMGASILGPMNPSITRSKSMNSLSSTQDANSATSSANKDHPTVVIPSKRRLSVSIKSPNTAKKGLGFFRSSHIRRNSLASNTSSVTVTSTSSSSLSPRLEIGTPYNVQNKLHVDKSLNWSVDNSTEFMDLFECQSLLGRGSHGSVYKAKNIQTGLIMAVKQIDINVAFQNPEDRARVEHEINLLKSCKHQNIVQYFGCVTNNTHMTVLMEYCAGGSLADCIQRTNQCLTEQEIGWVVVACLQGLAYLHHHDIVHRDIKAGNILLTDAARVKIADLGVSKRILDPSSVRKSVVGTPFWMSPEVITSSGYNTKADIWSLGITCIELAEGRPPLSELNPMKAIFQIPILDPPTLTFQSSFSHQFNDFIACCLIKDPQQRYSAIDLLQHPFVQQLHSRTQATGSSLKRFLDDPLNSPRQTYPSLLQNIDAAKDTEMSIYDATVTYVNQSDHDTIRPSPVNDFSDSNTMEIDPTHIYPSPDSLFTRDLQHTCSAPEMRTVLSVESDCTRSTYSDRSFEFKEGALPTIPEEVFEALMPTGSLVNDTVYHDGCDTIIFNHPIV